MKNFEKNVYQSIIDNIVTVHKSRKIKKKL